MRTKAKRKAPITAAPRDSARSSSSLPGASSKATQAVIQQYHVLLKRKSVLEKHLSQATSSGKAKDYAQQLAGIEEAIEQSGGLHTYQEASTLGQDKERGGDSSKVLVGWLKELGEGWRQNEPNGKRPMRMLEIGALSPANLAARQSYIDNTPIDLNSQHPDILKQDFMERPLPTSDAERFDLISCSLVLNFVPLPEERGRMLRLMHRHMLPSSSSYLFMVLPLPCVANSRYITPELFTDLMHSVGFEQVKSRWRDGGKVAYWLFRWIKPEKGPDRWRSKRIVNEGKKRNNFAITLS